MKDLTSHFVSPLYVESCCKSIILQYTLDINKANFLDYILYISIGFLKTYSDLDQ